MILITSKDYAVSATTLMMPEYLKVFDPLIGRVDKMVDLGCAYGGVTATVAYRIKAKEVYGVDKLADRLDEAHKKGIITIKADLNNPPYICGGGTFDLVISNGVIEHLNWYDDLIEESYRLLKDGGYLVLAFPNLANYIQRIALLFGYQPTDVCISRKIYAGTLYCRGNYPESHMRSCTNGAMTDLLEHYGFRIVSVTGADPELNGLYSKYKSLFRLIGKMMPLNFSRRLIVVAQKQIHEHGENYIEWARNR